MEVANLVLLAGYLIHTFAPTRGDQLQMRALLTVSSALFCAWGSWNANWIAVAFNALFFVISVYKIVELWTSRRRVALTPEQARFHETLVPDLNTRQAYDLWMLGFPEDTDEAITRQGEDIDHITVLLSGECEVSVDGVRVSKLTSLAFVGEITFFRGGAATATVTPIGTVKTRVWPREVIHTVEHLQPALHRSFVRAMAADLADKLNA